MAMSACCEEAFRFKIALYFFQVMFFVHTHTAHAPRNMLDLCPCSSDADSCS